MFFASSLTETQAELIAQAYYKSGKNPRQMAAALGTPTFDLELIRHPLVKRQINKLAERMRKLYSLEEHLDRLQEIRDAAMSADNFRIALAAEISVGKAAGLYEKVAETVDENTEKLNELSTEQLRKRLASVGGQPLLEDNSLDIPVVDDEPEEF